MYELSKDYGNTEQKFLRIIYSLSEDIYFKHQSKNGFEIS